MTIDWRVHACELDRLAFVKPRSSSASEENKVHAKVAAALKKAAVSLRSHQRQSDPLLYGVIEHISKQWPEDFGSFHRTRWLSKKEARLSDFLRALAEIFEATNPPDPGIPELPRSQGDKGAATEAAVRVRAFFISQTGQPHDSAVNEVVKAYFPRTKARNPADSASRRKNPKK